MTVHVRLVATLLKGGPARCQLASLLKRWQTRPLVVQSDSGARLSRPAKSAAVTIAGAQSRSLRRDFDPCRVLRPPRRRTASGSFGWPIRLEKLSVSDGPLATHFRQTLQRRSSTPLMLGLTGAIYAAALVPRDAVPDPTTNTWRRAPLCVGRVGHHSSRQPNSGGGVR